MSVKRLKKSSSRKADMGRTNNNYKYPGTKENVGSFEVMLKT